jgi:formamidopyrimidine-DNA glycosylase
MPELPEVQTVVDTVAPHLVGQRFRSLRHLRADIVRPCGFDFASAVVGRAVSSITRRGKRIVFLLDSGERFYIHLGMTGQLTVESPDSAIKPHTHLIAGIGSARGGRELRFRDPRRFGGIFWQGGGEQAPDKMGPEPLKMTTRQFAARLRSTARPIKNALMDQRLIAGLGNIYVDESLFAARIHPLVRADALTPEQVATLCRSIKRTLRRAIRHRGSSIRDYRDGTGAAGAFQKLHQVYGRASAPCFVCETSIERIILGGRSTHYCPKCQTARRTG